MKEEKNWLCYLSPTTLILLMLPLCFGYKTCDSFVGISGFYPKEQYYYLSVSTTQSVKDGVWLYTDPYGRIDDKGILINPIGNFVYLICMLFKLPLLKGFLVYLFLSAILLLWSFYKTIQLFVRRPFFQFIGAVLFIYGSGISYWSEKFGFKSYGLDNSAPDVNMFQAMQGEFYLPLANAFLLLCIYCLYQFFSTRHLRTLCILLCLFGFVYIYGYVLFILIAMVYWLYRSATSGQPVMPHHQFDYIWLGLTTLPFWYYMWIAFKVLGSDEDLWINAPSAGVLAASYGFMVVPTLLCLIFILVLRQKRLMILLVWFIVCIFLVYPPIQALPFSIQMLLGFGALCSILTAIFLEKLFDFARKLHKYETKTGQWALGVLLLLYIIGAMSTNINLYSKQIRAIRNQELPYCIPKNYRASFQWCFENLKYTDKVIVHHLWALHLGGISGCKVHYTPTPDHIETASIRDYNTLKKWMLEGRDDSLKVLAHRHNINYLIDVENFSGHLQTGEYPQLVYRNPGVRIYQL